MLRVEQVKLPLDYNEKTLMKAVCEALKLTSGEIKNISIFRRSIDARRKDSIHYTLSVDVELKNEKSFKLNPKKHKNISYSNIKNFAPEISGSELLTHPPVVVGCGPAGLFCAYYLAKKGYRPILLERGDCISERDKKVEAFWQGGPLDTESNVQFGEGGAGAYSDGKLNTMVKDTEGRIRAVLKTFIENGAKEDILYDAKPHIGTDALKPIIAHMTEEIRNLGGTVRYRAKLSGLECSFENGERKVSAALLADGERIPCETLVLALGHSARDTFQMLLKEGVGLEPKPFAVGVRMEHPQELINRIQYGEAADKLPAAPYKLTHTTEAGRGVYSFCMCPGGVVVNASSEENMLAVNGMSYSKRDSGIANSAIIVTVNPEDFECFGPLSDSPLKGMEFQRRLEARAYSEARGKIPQQLYGDFKENRTSSSYGDYESSTGGQRAFGNLRNVLPDFVCDSIIESMPAFNRYMPGFDRDDAILSGVESRTSSPVRMLRNENLESNIAGLYPCGEGAGYAGGIVSAAADGLRVFEAIIKKYKPE